VGASPVRLRDIPKPKTGTIKTKCMSNKKISEMPNSVKNDIVDFVNQRLEKDEAVEKIIVGQKK
jgi:hypothetical protein